MTTFSWANLVLKADPERSRPYSGYQFSGDREFEYQESAGMGSYSLKVPLRDAGGNILKDAGGNILYAKQE